METKSNTRGIESPVDETSKSVLAVLVVRVASAIGTAAFTYLLLTLIIVVNLLWGAYQDAAAHALDTVRSQNGKAA